jgi:hypothetical protein
VQSLSIFINPSVLHQIVFQKPNVAVSNVELLGTSRFFGSGNSKKFKNVPDVKLFAELVLLPGKQPVDILPVVVDDEERHQQGQGDAVPGGRPQ